MFLENILTMAGIALYALSSLMAVLAVVRRTPSENHHVPILLVMGAALLIVVLGMHAARSGQLPVFGRFEAVSAYVLIMTAAYLRMAPQRRMQGVAAIVGPYLTGMLLWGGAAAGRIPPLSPSRHTAWLGLHACTAFIACGLFSMAGLLAVAYLVQDHNLKQKRMGALFDRLPALEALDRLMSRHVGTAFFVLTISIAVGFVMLRQGGGIGRWLTDPKVLATLAIWALHAVLVLMRAKAGRHGKGVALATVLGFCCVLAIFIGVYAVSSRAHGSLGLTLNGLS